METILVWLGSGFAFAVGFFAGMIVMTIACRDKKKSEEINAEVNALLGDRNIIGKMQSDSLYRIAEAASELRKAKA